MSKLFTDQGDSQKPWRRQWQRREKQIAESKEADDIPRDLLIEILLRLPPKDIGKFRCVSKQWYHLLTKDNEFAARHSELSKRNPILLMTKCFPGENGEVSKGRETMELTSVDMEGNVADRFTTVVQGIVHKFISCGPLVLLCCEYNLYVFNPSKQEATDVPYNFRIRIQNAGFGYLPVSREYKIVLLFEEVPMLYLIFTFRSGGTGSWGGKTQARPESVCPKYSLNLDGKIYWAGSSCLSKGPILSFDLEEEKFNSISYPPHECNMYSFSEITGIRGSLGAIGCPVNSSTMEVWLFNDKENSWCMERQINLFPLSMNYVVSSPSQGDEILIHTEQKGFVIYNIRSLSWKRIKYLENGRSFNIRPCAYHYHLFNRPCAYHYDLFVSAYRT